MNRKNFSLFIEKGEALSMNVKIRYKFYGEHKLKLNPSTYIKGLHVYKILLSLLREIKKDVLPVKFWLIPLA